MAEPAHNPWEAPLAPATPPVPSTVAKFQVVLGLGCLALGAFGGVMSAVAPSRAVGGSTQVLLLGVFFVALGTKTLLDTSTAATLAGLSGAWLRGRVVSRVLTAIALLAALGGVAFTVSALP